MRVEHIALYVNDLEGARRFFVKYFGATSNDGYHNPQTDFARTSSPSITAHDLKS